MRSLHKGHLGSNCVCLKEQVNKAQGMNNHLNMDIAVFEILNLHPTFILS